MSLTNFVRGGMSRPTGSRPRESFHAHTAVSLGAGEVPNTTLGGRFGTVDLAGEPPEPTPPVPARVISEPGRLPAATGSDEGLDWFRYMPASDGTPEFIERAANCLRAMQNRVESAGGGLWADRDHNGETKLFLISQIRTQDGELFVGGRWTPAGLECRHLVTGFSLEADVAMFDAEILRSLKLNRPPGAGTVRDLPAAAQAARLTEGVLGLIGALCVDLWPADGVCGIYRLVGDRLEPAHGVFLFDLSPQSEDARGWRLAG